ncbi:phage tail length tape measure family protein [Ancylobacter sp. IITR112]|uniref:phage tail length tape measure family protein n=1 Tax=Ancylobacter sp. IITR112 TaxID=3138073 RepID=UPI00352B3320
MASVEEIRRLTLQAKSEGVQQVTNEVNQLAAAQGEVATATGRAATVTDSATRSLLSAEQALHRQRLGYDTAYAAQNRMEKALSVLDLAFKQNIINSDQLAAEQEKIAARFSRSAGAADELTAAQRRLNAEQKASAALSGLGSASAAFSARQNANERANSLMSSLGQAPAIINQTATSTKLATHEVSNLTAQLQDIGVSLAGGQSPFLVMTQQGSQISQIMGKRGLTEILSGVGQGLLALINPTTLALGGLVIGGYAAYAAFQALSGETETLEELMERSSKTIGLVTDAYNNAETAAGNFSERSKEILTLQATDQLEKLQRRLDDFKRTFAEGFTSGPVYDPMGNFTGVMSDDILPKYQAFAEIIEKFRDGQTDVRGFAEEVARLGNSSPALRDLANEIIRNVDAGLSLEQAMEKAAATVAQLAGKATEAQQELLKLRNAQRAVDTLEGLDREISRVGDPRAQFVGRYLDQNRGADPAKIREIEEQANKLYDLEQAQKTSAEAARDAENRQKQLDRAYERSKQQVDDYVRDIELQTEAFGLSAGEVERLRVRQELLTNAQRAGKDVTAELNAEIEAYADRAAVAAQGYEDLQKRQDAFNDAANGFAQLGYDAFSGLISGGKEFGDVITDLTDKLLEMALQAALLGTGPLAGLFGTTGTNGAPGGILGSLVTGIMGAIPGNAAGNDNWRGGLSIVGEHGPELVNLPKGAQVSPTQDVFGAMKAMASMSAAGGGSQVNVQVVNNAGAKVGVEKSTGANGEVNLKLTIERMVETAMVDQFQARGRAARTLETNYPGLRRGTA